MIVGHHLIWTAYGWWLPNDPRGSSSHEIRIERIAALGELHHGRKIVQPPSEEIRRFYADARLALKHELLTFTDQDVALLAASFAGVLREQCYTCYGCAIMPDHIHVLIRKHRHKAEQMIAALQAASQAALIEAGRRLIAHPVWGGPGWKVFLDTRDAMTRVAQYIGDNPTKAGLPEQHWDFVQPYNGWLPW